MFLRSEEPTFFSDTCTFFRLGQAPEKFFRKISVKKKIGLPENLEIFFFQKVDFSRFWGQTKKFVFFPSERRFGSGQTWHMTKIIFQKKNPFYCKKHKKVLGSILRSSVKE